MSTMNARRAGDAAASDSGQQARRRAEHGARRHSTHPDPAEHRGIAPAPETERRQAACSEHRIRQSAEADGTSRRAEARPPRWGCARPRGGLGRTARAEALVQRPPVSRQQQPRLSIMLAQLATPQVRSRSSLAAMHEARAAHSSTFSGRTVARGSTISTGISRRRRGLAQVAAPQPDCAVAQVARCGSQRSSQLMQPAAPQSAGAQLAAPQPARAATQVARCSSQRRSQPEAARNSAVSSCTICGSALSSRSPQRRSQLAQLASLQSAGAHRGSAVSLHSSRRRRGLAQLAALQPAHAATQVAR